MYSVSDMISKLLFKFRSGTHGLNEELGRHNTRNVIVKLLSFVIVIESLWNTFYGNYQQ